MALFDRKPVNLGRATSGESKLKKAQAGADDPLSAYFDPGGGDDPGSLVNYLIAVQIRKFGESVLSQYGKRTLQSNVKSLLKRRKCTALTVKRATQLAADKSVYPFTYKYVDALIDEVLESCPE